MKILHCITSLGRSGAEKTLINLINNSQFEHIILTISRDVPLLEDLEKSTAHISLLPFSLKKLKKINNLIINFSPDLIQGWMYHGDLLASFLGVIYRKKVYWNIRHGKMSFLYENKITYILRILLTILSHISPKRIISCSFCGENTHRDIGYRREIFNVIHNGISSKNIQQINIEDSFLDLKNISIGSIGRNHPQKGRKYFRLIINSLKIKLDFKKVFIVGRDVSKSKDALKLKNSFRNLIEIREEIKNMNEIYNKINVLLITSRFGEGCPNVLIEAIQRGIVCFSTDVGDARYLLNDDDFIIPSDNHLEAAIQIRRVLNSQDLYNKIKKIKKRLEQILDMKLIVSKYENLWAYSLSSKSRNNL